MSLKEGDRIRFNPEGDDYVRFEIQHKGREGTVTFAYEDSVIVVWDGAGGDTFSYFPWQIVPIVETQPPKTFCILPGTRVRLNPEGFNYQQLKNYFKEKEEGCIIDFYLTEPTLRQCKGRLTNPEATVNVKIGSKRANITLSHLIDTNEPPVNVTIYRLHSDTHYVIDNNPRDMNLIDELVIRRQMGINSIEVFDDEARARISS